jgi:hypothetical protein
MSAGKSTPTPSDRREPEREIAAVLSATLFPGRTTLRVQEVADALSLSVNHVIDLLEEGRIIGVNTAGAGSKTTRAQWRIPCASYDTFILNNRS